MHKKKDLEGIELKLVERFLDNICYNNLQTNNLFKIKYQDLTKRYKELTGKDYVYRR